MIPIRGLRAPVNLAPPPEPRAPRRRLERRVHVPTGATTQIAKDIIAFMERTGMSQSAFAAKVGQSSNWRNGLLAKAREGRLKPETVAKVRAVMRDWGAE